MHVQDHNQLAGQFCDMFRAHNTTHAYNTQQGNQLTAPKHKTNGIQ